MKSKRSQVGVVPDTKPPATGHKPSRQPLPPPWVKPDDKDKPTKQTPLRKQDKPPAQDRNVL